MALLQFEEFDEEPEPEDEREEESDEPPLCQQEAGAAAQSPKQKEDEKVKERLVELHRMARGGQAVIRRMAENDGPGKVGRDAEDFLIEEVAEPDEESDQSSWH